MNDDKVTTGDPVDMNIPSDGSSAPTGQNMNPPASKPMQEPPANDTMPEAV